MENIFDFESKIDIAWCPGCGNYSIRKALLAALKELDLARNNVVLVSGIGQAAKMPHYINTSFFNGLHGRALPPATAIKACNPELDRHRRRRRRRHVRRRRETISCTPPGAIPISPCSCMTTWFTGLPKARPRPLPGRAWKPRSRFSAYLKNR